MTEKLDITTEQWTELLSDEKFVLYFQAYNLSNQFQQYPTAGNREAYEQAVEAIRAWENLHTRDDSNHIDLNVNS